jgi:hypothetical protein
MGMTIDSAGWIQFVHPDWRLSETKLISLLQPWRMPDLTGKDNFE